ncbi:hypothetical protein N657DRAFT_650246 [Parathielavia appendiculata]|uniref:Uncharacterized protein n=1 Tax=Parathielavia appendiculata TaxID=2587402 RepID=A0AAN6TRN2_9PEZI|nr:hypothetical protein N657DRAFT_650246 [Parathielavia appendiculata]
MEVATDGAQMAHGMDDEFSQLWQRHLKVLRGDFSKKSVQTVPSMPSEPWDLDGEGRAEKTAHPRDGQLDSVVDALDELTRQSPNTIDTHSPGTPWFPDRDGHTETTLSSASNSSWPRTLSSPGRPSLPHLRIDECSAPPYREPKGKGTGILGEEIWQDPPIPFILQRQLLSESYPAAHYTATNFATTTAVPQIATATSHGNNQNHTHPSLRTTQKPPPTEVHVLILTWATHNPTMDHVTRQTTQNHCAQHPNTAGTASSAGLSRPTIPLPPSRQSCIAF